MAKPPREKPTRFKIVVSGPEGRSETSGELVSARWISLMDMFLATLTYGEKCVPGLSEVLDRYIADVKARRAETDANGGKVPV